VPAPASGSSVRGTASSTSHVDASLNESVFSHRSEIRALCTSTESLVSLFLASAAALRNFVEPRGET
jgi:hypothetical protein